MAHKHQTIDWIIHYVDMDDQSNPYLSDIHTHGLDMHNHKELCLVLGIGQETSANLLNNMGAYIAFHGKQLTDSIHSDVLENGYNIEIMSIPNDPVSYVILPDKNNKFPSDTNCEFPYNKQYDYVQIISQQNQGN